MMKVTVQRLLEVAFNEVGYTEQPVNKTKYAKYFGTDGIQWCGVFVNWCFEKSGGRLHNTWYTPTGAQGFKVRKQWKSKGKVLAGDIIYFDFPNDNVDRISHVGIAVKDLGKSVLCIEGNTTLTGYVPKGKDVDERNGGAVSLKIRDKSLIVGWGRPDYQGSDYKWMVEKIVLSLFPPKKGKK
jgi:hypothetical protein